MRNITILGSTGSIGVQTLDICRELPGEFRVVAMTCGSNLEVFEKQVREFLPELVAVQNTELAARFSERIGDLNVSVRAGDDGVAEVAAYAKADTLVAAIVGMAGLRPVYEGLRPGLRLCLANKEVLVAGGRLVMDRIRELKVELLPVDSEHSAIFQSLTGHEKRLEKILLTASGGPFRGFTSEQLEGVTLEQTLKHPNWVMGQKITVDSATLMNKGLEVIEAKWLFDVQPEQIEVVVHPESIIHSMVQFTDGSVIGQLGLPDMRLPIRYALTWPDRRASAYERLDLKKIGKLTFDEPDMHTFKCLGMAYEALRLGDGACVVLNSANEMAVAAFLKKEISFSEIATIIGQVLERNKTLVCQDLSQILALDRWARTEATRIMDERSRRR